MERTEAVKAIQTKWEERKEKYFAAIKAFQDAHTAYMRKQSAYERMLSAFNAPTVDDRKFALLDTEDGKDLLRLLREYDLELNIARYNVYFASQELEYFINTIKFMVVDNGN